MPYSDILRQGNFTFEEQGLLKINNSKVIVRYVTVFAAGWAVIAYLLADGFVAQRV